MRAALKDMRGRGVHLSLLDPFDHAFYRRYGWELAMEGIGYTLKPNELPTSKEQRYIRDCREEDLPQVQGLLEKEAARHPCGVRRHEGRWRQLLEDGEGPYKDLRAAIYEKEGAVEGYLLYEHSEREGRSPSQRLSLYEIVARTSRARAGLLSFGAVYDPLEFEVKYEAPRGEPLHPYLESSYVDGKIEPGMMLRIVDVEGALGLLRRKTSEPLVLNVSDDGIPDNAGEYTVGGGEVLRGAEAGERVTLDVRQLAQLYAGYLPVRELVRRGYIGADSEKALELLEEMFPAGDPWVFSMDRF